MTKFLMALIILLSLNSFAREAFIYDQNPFNRKTAAQLTEKSKQDYVFGLIYNASKNGECTVNIGPEYPRMGVMVINLDENGIKLLKSLGYEVTSDERRGYLITWCD